MSSEILKIKMLKQYCWFFQLKDSNEGQKW